MKPAIPIIIMAAACAFSVLAEEPSTTTIDDGDKGSGKYGNLVDKVETAQKSYDALNAVSTGAKAAKGLKSFDPKKLINLANLKKKAKEEALAWATKYTAAKGGFNTIARNILKKVDTIINRVSDRVDMWRTTWPTIKRYASSVKRLADNTKKIFHDFQFKDMWDIDRKWDRRLQANIDAYANTYANIAMFLKGFVEDDKKKFFRNSIVPSENDDRFRMDPLCILAQSRMVDLHPYRLVPENTLEFCSSTMYSLSEIESKNTAPDDTTPTLTKEEAAFQKIQTELENGDQTYEDSRELSALIEQERAKVSLQAIQITQLQSAVELRYANLIKRDKELQSEQADFYQRSSRIMCAGKETYEQLEERERD